MIQCLGLRNKKNSDKKYEVFFEKGWRFNSIDEVFRSETLNKLLSQIPIEEQYNLYFTVADCYEEVGRKLREQWAIPFDIDNLVFRKGEDGLISEEACLDTAERAARLAAEALCLDYNDLSVVFSGNGVQFFIHLDKPITSEDYFAETRDQYKELARIIQKKLKDNNIDCLLDTSVWSKGRLMRLPNTINIKKDKPERVARVLNIGKTISYDIKDNGIIIKDEDEQFVKSYPKPDTDAVCTGCKFLVHCKTNQSEITEPEWFAMSTILVRLENGERLMHEYSEQHPGYSSYETELKIEHALKNTKPRTCKDIATRWDGCETCDNYGKVTSPIMIKGEGWIGSADFGYRERRQREQKDGSIKIVPGPVVYDDVIKAFAKLHPFFTMDGELYVYNGRFWEVVTALEVHSWSESLIKPAPTTAECLEVYNRLLRQRVRRRAEVQETINGFMNFRNCVVNFLTSETYPHVEAFGFTSVIPYDFDQYAEAPVWDKFMDDITEGDKEKRQAIEEFCGYCVSNDYYWLHKVLFLLGSGANGKSVLLKVLGAVVGKDNHSAIAIKDLVRIEDRGRLVGKYFNYSEETSYKSLDDSDMFKKLASGGVMSYKKLYVGTFEVENNAKFICSTNELPKNFDVTDGLYRRLAIIRLNAKFTEDNPATDPFIEQKLLKELSGICNRLIVSYRNLRERGALPYSAGFKKELVSYMEENNPVMLFCKDVVDLNGEYNDVIKVSEVYEHYKIYCETNRHYRPLNNIHFGREFTKVTNIKSDVIKTNNKAVRVYKNIRINKDY